MLSKVWSIVALTVAALGLFTPTAQARVSAAGTQHTTSHGGHYSEGRRLEQWAATELQCTIAIVCISPDIR
ncbi:hypothetical protein GGR60_001771 [Xanthomonas arboricola]|nr:hypothetical protein [Xanthomonas euroxanthea]